MPPLETSPERADEWVQEVFHTFWAVGSAASLTPEFSTLLDKACMYRAMSRTADNHRENNVLSEQVKAEEKATRQAFAEAYRVYDSLISKSLS